MIAFCWLFL